MDGFTRLRHRHRGRRRVRVAAAALVFFSALVPVATGAQEAGTVRGVVHDPDGRPVAGVRVTLPGSDPVPCADAADANDDGAFDISDPVFLLGFLFTLGPDPGPPFPDCGADPTGDGLDCRTFSLCP